MTTSGLDYSAGAIAGRAIKAVGADFVIRYVDDPNLGWRPKFINAEEYADLLANGVTVYLVFEVDTYDYTGGFLQGVVFATRALAGATAVGYEGPIFMTVDTHLSVGTLPTAIDYMQGAEKVLGSRLGVYGFSELIEACAMQGLGSAYWLCGSKPAPNSPTNIWQDNTKTVLVNGTECDLDWLLQPFADGGNDLTPEESQMLTDIHGQLCTPLDPWLGGMSNVENDGQVDPNRQKYFPVQTILRDNVTLTQLSKLLSSLSVGESGQFGAFSDADVEKFSAAVAVALATLLSSKLAS